MDVRRLYLDTNIFIHVFEYKDELSQTLKRLLLSGTGSDAQRHATSELTVAELVVVPFRQKDDALLRQYNNWTHSNDFLEVLAVDYADLWNAAVLRAEYKHLKTPDAIHLATAMRTRCSHILTADTGMKGSYRLDYSWDHHTIGPLSIEVLRPESSIVERLISPTAP